MPGENCSSTCVTKDHETFGECLRVKSIRVAYCQSAAGRDYTEQKKWDKNLDDYRSARSEGIEPKSTWKQDVDRAVQISDQRGEAFVAR